MQLILCCWLLFWDCSWLGIVWDAGLPLLAACWMLQGADLVLLAVDLVLKAAGPALCLDAHLIL
jgi:hypothetical protein